MEEKTIDEMIQAFIDNGLDLSYFKFIEDYDKENFFMMYTDLFESMMKEDEDYSFELTDDKDLNISLHGEEMFLYVVDDYQTLRCRLGRGYYDRENTNLKIIHYWFQQYKDEDSHPFHIHTNSDYSMVYFVELQEKSHSTVFIDHDKKQVQLDVKEGDLLLFPSLVFHSSPKNNSLTGKTILSANLNFVN